MTSHDLRLFGVIHPDRRGKVTAELDEYARDVDAIVIEHPMEPLGLRLLARGFLRVPLFFIGFLCYSFVMYHLSVPLVRSLQGAELPATRALRDAHGIPVHEVDRHPVEIIAGDRIDRRWIAANWLVLLGLAALAPVATIATLVTLPAVLVVIRLVGAASRRLATLVALPVVWLGGYLLLYSGYVESLLVLSVVLVGVLTVGVTIRRTLGPRNVHMLDRIEEIVEREGYETGCFVTGKAHLYGVIEGAEDRDLHVSRSHVSKWCRRSDHVVEDPDPDSGDWSDRYSKRDSKTTAPDLGTEADVIPERIIARIIDIAALVVLGITGALIGAIATIIVSGIAGQWMVLASGILLPLLFTPVAEMSSGQTPGKYLTGLVVIQEDGTPCTPRGAFVRNLLRPLDLLLFYGVGLVVMLVTDRRQRLGDLAADTIVVRESGIDSEKDQISNNNVAASE